MYTNINDIKFSEKDGFERRSEEDFLDYDNNTCRVFVYKNIVFSVCYPKDEFNRIEIAVYCTLKEQYFSTSMKELAGTPEFEHMDVRDFNMNNFIKSLEILHNISIVF